ncbi:unnamed protein product, partial [Didymodactylos carnosus]
MKHSSQSWDNARLIWLLRHNISNYTNQTEIEDQYNVLGSTDATVFQHINILQKHVIHSRCSYSDCPQLERSTQSCQIIFRKKNGCYPNVLEDFSYEQAGRCGTSVPENFWGDTFESDMLMEDGSRRIIECSAAKRIYSPKQFLINPPFCILDISSESRTSTRALPDTLMIGEH